MFRAPIFRLNDGNEIPVLGLGTKHLNGDACFEVVRAAIDLGYRHFDTSSSYGNERELGKAIRSKIKEGVVDRDEVFICTKLGNMFHQPNSVEHAYSQSLSNLQLDYIDLFLMEFPVGLKAVSVMDSQKAKAFTCGTDYVETWRAMEKLVEAGHVHSIGVSNFNTQQIQRLLQNCHIRPVVNQIECHVGFSQKKLIRVCHKNLIDVIAHSPLGQKKYFHSKLMKRLTAKYNREPAQLCLRYLLQIGTYPMPKTTDMEHLKDNYDVFDFILEDEDMQLLNKIKKTKRIVTYPALRHYKYYPF